MIKAIFATDLQGGMGLNGSLPWPYDREDMLWFKNNTTGHIIVMGSKTWDDPHMPTPLPNRDNIVVTKRNIANYPEAAHVIDGNFLLESLRVLEAQTSGKHIWIIGGAQLLVNARPLIKEVYHTHFDADYHCDVKLDTVKFFDGFTKKHEAKSSNKTFTVWHG